MPLVPKFNVPHCSPLWVCGLGRTWGRGVRLTYKPPPPPPPLLQWTRRGVDLLQTDGGGGGTGLGTRSAQHICACASPGHAFCFTAPSCCGTAHTSVNGWGSVDLSVALGCALEIRRLCRQMQRSHGGGNCDMRRRASATTTEHEHTSGDRERVDGGAPMCVCVRMCAYVCHGNQCALQRRAGVSGRVSLSCRLRQPMDCLPTRLHSFTVVSGAHP